MEQVTIKLNKKKSGGTFLISIIFIIFGILMLLSNNIIYIIIGTMNILFFGLISITIFKKLLTSKPGLIINNQGIFDNSSSLSVGLIKWENITNVTITKVFDQKFLTIEVNNATEILSKCTGLKKLLLKLNKRFYKNTPVQISSSILSYDFQKLHNLIKKEISLRNPVKVVNGSNNV